VNRFRFNGRLGGRRLGPGTYRIVARIVRSGRRLFVTRVVIVASGSPNRSQLAALWLRNACSSSSSVPPAGGSGAALTGAMPWLGSVTSGADLEGPAQRAGVLGAEASRNLSKPELPAGIAGLGSSDPVFQPNSARDWLRLFLFAVLGISLVFAIRHTVRDLKH
jgi:hypothetical protein